MLAKTYFAVLALFGLTIIGAQRANAQAGGAAVPFLLISPDARASGMGEIGTAIADDLNAIYWNPAGLAFHGPFDPKADQEKDQIIPWRQVSLTFSKWLPQFNADLFYSCGSFGQYFEELDGSLAFNFTFMNLGEFTRTDAVGTPLGKFNSNEFALGVSYGTIIANDLAAGVQLKYIQSNIAPSSSTSGKDGSGKGISGGFDLGFLWKPKNLGSEYLDDKVSLGLNLQNVGPKVTYRNASDPLPTQLRMGIAYTLVKDEYNDLKVSSDIVKLLVKRDGANSDPIPKSIVTGWKNPGLGTAFGSEYWYDNAVALRAGYFTEPARIGNRRFWNFGAGVKYDIFSLDFSFINTMENNHPLANTMRFSLLIDWK